MFDLIREIAQTLRNNKLRTALTGVAVAWGIFMLIVLMGMSKGVVNAFNENRHSQGSNMLKVWGGTTSEAWHGYKEGRTITLKDEDLDPIAKKNRSQVAAVTAQISGEALTISTPHDYMTSSYEGVFPAEARQRALDIVSGRFINELDLRDKRKVIVLSDQVAASLFADPGSAVGSSVRVGDLMFKVVGVYKSEWSRTVYVPYSTARALNGNSNVVSDISIELQNVETEADGELAETRAREALAALHDFKPSDESAVEVWNRFTQQLSMNKGMGILNSAVWAIGLLTLLSGIIGVSNIMFVSVRERTHEIGIRRAIGAKPRSILVQIILESVSITAIFGYIGIILGMGVTEVVARLSEGTEYLSDPRVDLSLTLSVTVVLIAAGIGAGLFPALKAIKVKPVEALRDE